ncbi:phosphatidylinositol phospholipase C [Magnaporthiopsis poae ATCC 64411]|uniref:Phosphatidylinositol phospholipase C n=1 Tax=Magnaporthiopsis poae (strain ATCC 64411 / 73-15) TaxID=644358 RepID=A0A0C4DP14_MAGP6|nr:phosphatidylinositol phospholipase C [Magnaporthiopsis poae ATCC 64411]
MDGDKDLDVNTVRRLNIHITLDQSEPYPGLVSRAPRGPQDASADPETSPIPTPSPAAIRASDDADSVPRSRWMTLLPDSTPLSALTIPGTHDSAARISLPFVQTQTLSITDQLATMGVRALDLRLRRDPSEGDKLYCYHGGVPLGPPFGSRLPLDDIMAEIWRFLGDVGTDEDSDPIERRRSGETVLALINNDDTSDSRDPAGRAAFYRAVEAFIAATPPWQDGETGEVLKGNRDGRTRLRSGSSTSRWYTEARAPTLGEVRGRCVLLRRFPLPNPAGGVSPAAPLGLDLSAWVNDSPDFTIISPHNRFRIQDKWLYPKRVSLHELIASKSAHVRYMIEQAAADSQRGGSRRRLRGTGEGAGARGDDADLWYINFCSAVGERLKYGEVADPKSVAAGAFVGWERKWLDGVNALTAEYITSSLASDEQASRSLGIIYMDFPELPVDNSLVRRLIQTNF